MKVNVPLMFLILVALSGGCSKSSNPVEFVKIEPNTTPQILSNRDYTILELYLAEKVDRDYVMSWFFSDASLYREKLFLIKDEIQTKKPFSSRDTNKIIFLEDGMNEAIRTFNEKNVFRRSRDIVSAAIETRKEKSDRHILYTLNDVRSEGAPASTISDTAVGFLGSFMKYGFTIELVNLLDR